MVMQLRNDCGLSVRVLYTTESRVADDDEPN
jgi:hypothetical protein